jgi:hypothetical protein
MFMSGGTPAIRKSVNEEEDAPPEWCVSSEDLIPFDRSRL